MKQQINKKPSGINSINSQIKYYPGQKVWFGTQQLMCSLHGTNSVYVSMIVKLLQVLHSGYREPDYT